MTGTGRCVYSIKRYVSYGCTMDVLCNRTIESFRYILRAEYIVSVYSDDCYAGNWQCLRLRQGTSTDTPNVLSPSVTRLITPPDTLTVGSRQRTFPTAHHLMEEKIPVTTGHDDNLSLPL